VVSRAGLLAIELGGTRGARLQRARARTAAVESDLLLSAWGIVRGTRGAAPPVAAAESDLTRARREAETLAGLQSLELARYREASLTSAELARTGAEVQGARAQVSAAEAAVLEARAALAGTLAIPTRAMEAIEVSTESSAGCATLESQDEDSLAAVALIYRPEMGRVLAEYAEAEAALRLEVAKQYPDLDLGPGFIWDQGVHRWTLALALPNLFGFRNRAAIDEANAARSAAAVRVAEVQDDLLADLQLAVGRCRGVMLERAAADSQVTAATRAADLARAAYERGETSRLDPAFAELAVVRADRTRAAAEARLRAAGQVLDAAAGIWSAGDPRRWPDPRTDQLGEDASR
jgi:outer membrane protein TolC